MTTIACPVLDCDWILDAPEPDPRSVQPETLAGVFGVDVFASVAVATHNERIERGLREHLEDHDLTEWVRTAIQLRKNIDAATAARDDDAERMKAYRSALSTLASRTGQGREAMPDPVLTPVAFADWLHEVELSVTRAGLRPARGAAR